MRRWFLGVNSVIILIVIALAVFDDISYAQERNVPPMLSAAIEDYYGGRFDKATKALFEIGSNKDIAKNHRRTALGLLVIILLDANDRDKAKEVISQLLDLEPPLITIFPTEKTTVLQELYEEVRRERIKYASPPSPIQAVAVLPFRNLSPDESALNPLRNIPGLLQFILIDSLKKHLPNNIVIVERNIIFNILQELYLSPKHHKKVSNFYLEWAYNIMPWIVLDELYLPDPIIRATHYIFGTFVVEKPTTDNRLASAPKILITAWIYDVATARLINSEQIGGHLSTSAMFPKLAQQLGVRITQYIKDRLK